MPSDILLDSCIFIDYFRTKDKSRSFYSRLALRKSRFFISSIVLFEVLCGVRDSHMDFWTVCLDEITILPFDIKAAETAADLSIRLRRDRIQLEHSDLFIAATAWLTICRWRP